MKMLHKYLNENLKVENIESRSHNWPTISFFDPFCNKNLPCHTSNGLFIGSLCIVIAESEPIMEDYPMKFIVIVQMTINKSKY